jgi:undecaprenyl-diphosphatase
MSAAGVLQYLAESDRRICGRLAGWAPPRAMLRWMMLSTRLGDGWLWAFVGLVLLAGGPAQWPLLAAAGAAAALANVMVVTLKGRVRRSRPAERPSNCFFAGLDRGWTFDEFSFPSGHALNAFALATTLSLAVPALSPLLLVLAVSIAASRVVLGVHFLTDALAGSALGVLAGAAAFAAVLR